MRHMTWLSVPSLLPCVYWIIGCGRDEQVRTSAKGVVTVLAAGNTQILGLLGSSQYGSIPAIVVGATGPDDEVAGYSSPLGTPCGPSSRPVEPAAREPRTTSTPPSGAGGQPNSYRALAGTSMATPQVSGAAALLLAKGLSPTDVVRRILETADSRVACGSSSPTCRGRLDVAAAVGESSLGRAPEPPRRSVPALPVSVGRLPLVDGLSNAR